MMRRDKKDLNKVIKAEIQYSIDHPEIWRNASDGMYDCKCCQRRLPDSSRSKNMKGCCKFCASESDVG